MKRKYVILLSLVIITATIIPNFWQLGMTAMVGFFLAYLTKGSRKLDNKNNVTYPMVKGNGQRAKNN